ncbi:AbrB/MazE/SpoVT family DNA-binding domain-containing protein [Campylobacter concisus]|uniref:AbrB/MazE/SpoVT family DNA-binding domain-containing protein n=1 Tax=Campylobacter concisus TaxID=199 RepID=UPI0011E6D819|nr:AbrB/MazE/SpoVT family DNA-binding domain-containing protein [Campylobacter concisus]
MITNLIQIGNSQGIRLPKAVIEQFGFKKISLEILKDGIFLRPVKQSDIDKWDTLELRKLAQGEKIDSEFEAIDVSDKEWQW